MTDEPESKTLLVALIRRAKAIADEIGDLQSDLSDVVKEGKGAGFDAVKIREVVRWLRKVDKHGRDKMDEAEAIFDLYRQVVDADARSLDAMMATARDKALLAVFAPDDQVEAKLTRRTQQARTAALLARAVREAGD